MTVLYSKRKISLLVNSVYFLKKNVFVIAESNYFRLVVINLKVEKVEDTTFPSLEQAQEYFERNNTMMESAAASDEIPEWTPLYRPGKKWLNKRLRSCVNRTDIHVNAQAGMKGVKKELHLGFH